MTLMNSRMMDEPTPPKTRTVQAVYTGKRRGAKTPLVARWVVLDDRGDLTTEELCFAAKGKRTSLNGGAWVGDVYSLEVGADGTCKALSRLRERCWDFPDDKAAWLLEEKAAETEVEMTRKKADADDLGQLTLAELADRYGKTIGRARRAAMLANIIQRVTG